MADFRDNYLRQDAYVTYVTSIPVGTSTSEAIHTNNFSIFGISMPAGWDAASISFDVSNDDITYQHLYDIEGYELVVAVGASKNYSLEPGNAIMLSHWKYMKLRSGVAGAYVNQTAKRSISIIGRRV